MRNIVSIINIITIIINIILFIHKSIAYDSENIGFVEVGFIKERVRTFYLSEQNLFYFMEGLGGFVDDEMLNLLEFKRVFREYLSSKG